MVVAAVADSLERFSCDIAIAALRRELPDGREVNDRMRAVSREDIDAGCLVWRQATNAYRLAGRAQLRHVLESMAEGYLVATCFHPEKTTATRCLEGWQLAGRGLLVTGVNRCSHILVEARVDGQGATMFAASRDLLSEIDRPAFLGLKGSDNAIVSLAGSVKDSARVGAVGDAKSIVEFPYELGLTMGAIAVEAGRAVMRLLEPKTEVMGDESVASIGVADALVEAASCFVDLVPSKAPTAALWSRAAKVAATRTAAEAADVARGVLGPATFSADHPLVALENAIRGLGYQAPTDAKAAVEIARGLRRAINQEDMQRREE